MKRIIIGILIGIVIGAVIGNLSTIAGLLNDTGCTVQYLESLRC